VVSLDISPEWFVRVVYLFDWVGFSPFVHKRVVVVLDY
jgi:hypothetical protein